MVSQRRTKDPCPDCLMHRERCLCAEIPILKLKTRLSLVIHYRELRRATNSGMLAVKAIEGSQSIVRGREGEPVELSGLLLPGYENLLFYPSEDAVELSDLRGAGPFHLIVPDGNWRQASKVAIRHKELANARRVKITAPNLAKHHLRKEHHEFGMSTLEAIASAIRILEGEAAAEPLFALYRLKLARTLEGRGVELPKL